MYVLNMGESGFYRRDIRKMLQAGASGYILKNCDIVIYLQAQAEQLIARTARDKKRPLLQVDDREQRIRDLLAIRDPLYREVATAVVNANSNGPKQVVDKIVSLLPED